MKDKLVTRAIYVLCILGILVQIPTATDIFLGSYGFQMFGPSIRGLQAFTYAVVFEFSLLVFVLQRRTAQAFVFAFFSMLTNLISYNVAPWLTALSPWLISIQLPVAIALFSHELQRIRAKQVAAEAQPQPMRPVIGKPVSKPAPGPAPRAETVVSTTAKPSNFFEKQPAKEITNGAATYAVNDSKIIPVKANVTEVTTNFSQEDSQAGAFLEKKGRLNVKLIDKVCEHCSKPYQAVNATSRFCGGSCKAKNWQQNNKKVKLVNPETVYGNT